ncbi:GNAT family N-acetyltransferase, partial [Pseudomonas sp. SIMBA_064]
VLVAIIDHKIVGFCSLDNGNIDLLFVHQNYLRQGIALKLYTQIEQVSRQKGKTRLTADVSKTAKPFFERVGFKVLKEQTVNVKG